MILKSIVPPLIGAALLLGVADASARERSDGARGDCSFCAPRYIAVEPQFEVPAAQPRMHGWIAASAGPYTRFDIEGLRLMTRMP